MDVVLLAGVQTLDVGQALFMPIGASLSLLVMFLFFDSLQLMFAVCTASTFALILSQQHIHNISVIKISPHAMFNYIQVKTSVSKWPSNLLLSNQNTKS